MLFAIKTEENSETSEKLASIKNQVEEFRLQDKHGKHKFPPIRRIQKKLFEGLCDTIEKTSGNVTFTETSFINNKTIEKLNENF